MSDSPHITEDWLREVGFKWSQFDRQPSKHWLLWIGGALVEHTEIHGWRGSDFEDLGIEVAANRDVDWFCWLRSDTAGRYHRFVHIRHIVYQAELVGIIEGLTGAKWDPANNIVGAMRSPESAARMRAESERLDLKMRAANPKWFEQEKDDTRSRALPEHMQVSIGKIEGGPT